MIAAMGKKQYLHYLSFLIIPVLFAVAVFVLHRELKTIDFQQVMMGVSNITLRSIVFAIFLTMMNYAVMTGYDALAFQYIGHPLSYTRIAFTAFVGYAFSNSLGMSMLAGSSVRFRLYSSWGVTGKQIAQTIAFTTLTLWLGLLGLAGVAFVLDPITLPNTLHLPFSTTLPLGVVCLVLIAAYLLMPYYRKEPIRIFKWSIPVPSFRLSVAQLAIAALDWAMAAAVLYILMPQAIEPDFPRFLAIFMLCQVLGLFSQIPGGLGVFETALLLLVQPGAATPEFLGALVLFRLIYYLFPLAIAAILLGLREALAGREGIRRASELAGRFLPEFAPRFLGVTTFLSGLVLLISGATPGVLTRLNWLNGLVPLPLLELSHFLGSLAGAGLLLLSRGIWRRLDSAYYMTVILLFGGIFFSLLKGFDYEEAIFLSAMLLALLPCRKYFYRKASFFTEPISLKWVIAVLLAVAGSIWLGFFTNLHVEYNNDLWWRFSVRGDAPRFLRAMVGVCVLLFAYAFESFLRYKHIKPSIPSTEELSAAETVCRNNDRTNCYLSLMGDKQLFFNTGKTAFIMYGIRNRSWISMGDPVGPPDECNVLLKQFLEACDQVAARPVFYEVEHHRLHRYLDAGLTLLKMGEEAKVALEDFSIVGNDGKGFRYSRNKVMREGYTFQILPKDRVPEILPKIKEISDLWLDLKNTREKGFSLGFFDESYLRRFPVALVMKDDRIFAFANVFEGGAKQELSIDLMRYVPEFGRDVMDYLFIELMLWGKNEGYKYFNFGMAPFSGLGDLPFRSGWNLLGHFLFRYGEHFYNFQGLRDYKQKFRPIWEPRYLAYPGGLTLPAILTDVAALISGGLTGVIRK
jgi:phosphatidylglycerol lysyltransferase